MKITSQESGFVLAGRYEILSVMDISGLFMQSLSGIFDFYIELLVRNLDVFLFENLKDFRGK